VQSWKCLHWTHTFRTFCNICFATISVHLIEMSCIVIFPQCIVYRFLINYDWASASYVKLLRVFNLRTIFTINRFIGHCINHQWTVRSPTLYIQCYQLARILVWCVWLAICGSLTNLLINVMAFFCFISRWIECIEKNSELFGSTVERIVELLVAAVRNIGLLSTAEQKDRLRNVRFAD